MTRIEASLVIRILLKADGGCPNCAKHLIENFMARFPEHAEAAASAFKVEFDDYPVELKAYDDEEPS